MLSDSTNSITVEIKDYALPLVKRMNARDNKYPEEEKIYDTRVLNEMVLNYLEKRGNTHSLTVGKVKEIVDEIHESVGEHLISPDKIMLNVCNVYNLHDEFKKSVDTENFQASIHIGDKLINIYNQLEAAGV